MGYAPDISNERKMSLKKKIVATCLHAILDVCMPKLPQKPQTEAVPGKKKFPLLGIVKLFLPTNTKLSA